MNIFVFMEPHQQKYGWHDAMLKSVNRNAARARLPLIHIRDLEEMHKYLNKKEQQLSILLVIATNSMWVNALAKRHYPFPIHQIFITNLPFNLLPYGVSSVSSDVKNAIIKLISYLQSVGRNSIAIYGVSMNNLSNVGNVEAFIPNMLKNHVYFNRGSLSACFSTFYENISDYDAVICTNEHAAISLMQNLKTQAPEILKKLFIITFSSSVLPEIYNPSITTVSCHYENFGRAAIDACKAIKKNPDLTAVHYLIKWTLQVRESTGNIPFIVPENIISELPANPTVKTKNPPPVFHDIEAQPLLLMEKLFAHCDNTDLIILCDLLRKKNYIQIGRQRFLSEATVKYRVKGMMKCCEMTARSKLIKLVEEFISVDRLEEYLKFRQK